MHSYYTKNEYLFKQKRYSYEYPILLNFRYNSHETCSFNLLSNKSLMSSTITSNTSRHNLALFVNILSNNANIFIIYRLTSTHLANLFLFSIKFSHFNSLS